MSMFSPYSRAANQQNQQQQTDFISDNRAELDNQAASGLSYAGTSAASSVTASLSNGVSDFLDQIDLDSGSAGLNGKFTPLQSGIEYLSLDGNEVTSKGALPSRGWSDDLCYGAGTMYLSGLAIGGTWGFFTGAKLPAKNFKIKLNGILNNMTRRGPFVGNSLGVLGLYYNSLYSIIGNARSSKDFFTSVYSAGLTGLIFRSTKGIKSALVASVVFSSLMAAYQFATNRENVPDFDWKKIKQAA
ncbi:Mitochondrial import inner membrane translocase subunit tim23 [Smittium culicis]|uniref:Mitochondrial import inner membrane translocase subunit tim23 n=1 Tax=Smittium culicis TaxID=133412 RepID=A0A1R1XLA1_9FUNG|nr:Mitochondrial import inner membrane translocase subunit tim23 [Smittium culicis]